MKRLVLIGAIVSALGAGAYAQGAGSQDAPKPARKAAASKGSDQGAGHTAPKPQPRHRAEPSLGF